MDTVTETPVEWTDPLPAPFSSENAPIRIDGPHQYATKNWVGRISLGHTPEQAFAALSPRAAPFQSGPSVDGGVVDIPVLGPIRQHVDPDHLTIVNTTLPGHKLHPGNVFRSIVQEGDDLYVVTHGYGTGIFPKANEHGAPPLWNFLDLGVRGELNPDDPTLRGYPMDEMNALVGIGNAQNGVPIGSTPSQTGAGNSTRSALPTNAAPLGIFTNQPMPDWPVQPPIFNTR